MATPLVVELLEGVPAISRMLVMVQAEVGERLAAGAGEQAYGAVSVKVAYFAEASVVGRVPPTVFLPQPKVDSALVALARRPAPAVDPAAVAYERLAQVVRAGFHQRRKMLRRALAGVVEEGAFERAGVAPTARAEELDVQAWGRLAAWPPSAAS
ncbi:MAG: ribosomal RNA small subunit methyltransferase A [Acidimicrobiales bacterium]